MERERRSQRLAQLERLAAEVAQLPPSLATARLLRQVRSRAVSVDTGPENPSGWGQREGDGVEGRRTDRDRLADELSRTR